MDPVHYVSAPGLAWEAMLLNTKVELDLITDLEIMDMIERQKRGGLCFVGSKRYVEANNKYLENYDPSKPPNCRGMKITSMVGIWFNICRIKG